MVEFVVNNNDFTFIKISPFFISRGLYLQISFNVVDFFDITTHKQINKKNPSISLELYSPYENMRKNLC